MKSKYLLTVVILLSLSSCITNNIVSNNIEPLWFSDTYNHLDMDKFFVFKAKGSSFEDAYNSIENSSSLFSSYVLPTKEKEFSNNDSFYLLYSINKNDLIYEVQKQYKVISDSIENIIKKGDKSTDILSKYKFYKEAENKFSELDPILSFTNKYDIPINKGKNRSKEELVKILEFTKAELVIGLKIKGDFNNMLESLLINELHNLGYETSSSATVILEVNLNLEDAVLDNKYLNKYWTITLELMDSYGNSNKSLMFNGRESQLSEASLNQLIIKMASKQIKENLKDILP